MTSNTSTDTDTSLSDPMSPAQAATYQQLRAHLAALKLTAAEHLPTVLDQARSEKLTITAALERLMALEVDADAARRLAGRPQTWRRCAGRWVSLNPVSIAGVSATAA